MSFSWFGFSDKDPNEPKEKKEETKSILSAQEQQKKERIYRDNKEDLST